MQLKDYYRILGVEPGATYKEIKQAYRKLALQYHPDKMGNDKYAAAMYTEIREAYETLISPAKKDNYLQQRWYQQSQGVKTGSTEPLSPISILNEAVEMNRYAASINPFRINKESLAQHIQSIVTPEKIAILNGHREDHINEQVKKLLLGPVKLLQHDDASLLLEKIKTIIPQSREFETEAEKLLTRLHKNEFNSKYETLFIVLLTIVLCFLIYFLTR